MYVQTGGGLGFASYHFLRPGECYISYESALSKTFPELDDGSQPPPKKLFQEASYDPRTRTFKGVIDWSPTSWQGDQQPCCNAFVEDVVSTAKSKGGLLYSPRFNPCWVGPLSPYSANRRRWDRLTQELFSCLSECPPGHSQTLPINLHPHTHANKARA